jgi:C4-dicarboxylate-specific signal transduction histidine kinase
MTDGMSHPKSPRDSQRPPAHFTASHSRRDSMPPTDPDDLLTYLHSELEKSRAKLLQADRLATLGTMAASIGHELNNVVAILAHTATFIRTHADQGNPPEPQDLTALDRGVAHLAQHARNLLHLGTPAEDRPEIFDVMTVVSDVITMLNVSGRTKRVNIMTQAPPGAVRVTMSRTKLEQIFVNLITNAADALADQPPEGRIIRVEVHADHERNRARCVVEDAGHGMQPEVLARVFEEYFTTKAPGKGTGLGLWVVKTLLDAVDGTIEIESEVGKGTAVRFDIPMCS